MHSYIVLFHMKQKKIVHYIFFSYIKWETYWFLWHSKFEESEDWTLRSRQYLIGYPLSCIYMYVLLTHTLRTPPFRLVRSIFGLFCMVVRCVSVAKYIIIADRQHCHCLFVHIVSLQHINRHVEMVMNFGLKILTFQSQYVYNASISLFGIN